jgi:apolipoprotein D and lipocalin family protein
MRHFQRLSLVVACVLTLGGCASTPPIRTVDHVDLERFMGDWYVIANIPTFIEEGAHNAIESYRLDDDGTIATTFTFRAGGFDGELKRYEPRGFVGDDPSRAVWGMQFIWPFKAEYRIIYLNDDYTRTIIGRSARDYVWIMARSPRIGADEYDAMLQLLAEVGYDVSLVQKVPQSW